MKYEEYQTLKKDSIFNSKVAFVCEACFLELTRYCNFNGSNTENVLRTIRPTLGKNVQSRYMHDLGENLLNRRKDTLKGGRSNSVDPRSMTMTMTAKSFKLNK